MSRMIRYFGAGANRDAEMMEAIIGRRPEGQPATLHGYDLAVQYWSDINEDVKSRLTLWSAEDNFRTYFIRRSEGKSVKGMVWYITEDERRLVENWEFWYTPITENVVLEDGQTVEASAEMIEDYKSASVAESNYPVFLNDKGKMIEVAREERGFFLERTRFVENLDEYEQ